MIGVSVYMTVLLSIGGPHDIQFDRLREVGRLSTSVCGFVEFEFVADCKTFLVRTLGLIWMVLGCSIRR